MTHQIRFAGNVLLLLPTLSLMLYAAPAGAQDFTRVLAGDPVTDGEGSRSVAWVDVDNDGDLDLFVSNGRQGGENNMLYINDGTGTLVRDTAAVIAKDGRSSDGAIPPSHTSMRFGAGRTVTSS